jgi:hypothetical protein
MSIKDVVVPARTGGVQVILFGGGDGGGLIIGPHGVRPIPPFDPALRKQLKAINTLTQAVQLRGQHAPAELASLTNKLANVAIGELEAVVGPLDPGAGLTYQDDDGGFTCGSTGKPPIPFPWPPAHGPSIEDLLSSGVLERELVTVLRSGKVGIKELLHDPKAASAAAGVELSERSRQQLHQLDPSQIANLADPEAREIATFFHKVLDDGRYLETWSMRPHEVSATLGVKLSDAAIDRIVAGGSTVFRPGGGGSEVANAAIGVAVAVGVVIMLVTKDPFQIPIRDQSGIRKF